MSRSKGRSAKRAATSSRDWKASIVDSGEDEHVPFEVSLGYHLRQTHRLTQRLLQDRIQPYGLTLGIWYFLRALWQQDGLTQRELSASVGTMEPTTLAAIGAMERKGLVTRSRNSDDRRRINIYLTQRGRELKSQVMPAANEAMTTATADFSARELELLFGMLRAIQRNVQSRIGDTECDGTD